MIQCWIFGNLPGVKESWTLAVEAVSERDARQWVRAVYKGGKMLQHVPPDGRKVTASCGAMTDAAQAFLHEKVERELSEWKRVNHAGN
jgi:hypothetical protein